MVLVEERSHVLVLRKRDGERQEERRAERR